ncbi:hypothetical protein [Paenarthrobacter ureafaciens]|nr:hypothetical protein [Paenarthrobacter ureafaciens]AOY71179.1 hypothetical protein ARZXY2_1634 [Arthrobacter sp. ZXY-2]WNZ04936.1 hypothetical protein PVT25_05220 [Paenarthrobacter ureafaciens]
MVKSVVVVLVRVLVGAIAVVGLSNLTEISPSNLNGTIEASRP